MYVNYATESQDKKIRNFRHSNVLFFNSKTFCSNLFIYDMLNYIFPITS